MDRRTLLLKTLAWAGTAGLAAGCGESKPQFKSVDITGVNYGKGVQLPDPSGKVRTLDEFRGKAVVVFFGYTQCPDVCPTTMLEVAQAKKLLGPDGDKVQGVFVTVDPERDTPEVLAAYVKNFDPTFVALRGTPEQTAAAAKEFKVYYKKNESKSAGVYTMDHSAASFVFDPQGKLRLYTRYGMGAESLAGDLKLLLKS
ncbi:SCO family protein [Ramlibacter sp.]|uniref:SCO family protein n=1 Tax=Ramlibacter sp. TaxID=1917967 RepID=UPI003D0EAE20